VSYQQTPALLRDLPGAAGPAQPRLRGRSTGAQLGSSHPRLSHGNASPEKITAVACETRPSRSSTAGSRRATLPRHRSQAHEQASRWAGQAQGRVHLWTNTWGFTISCHDHRGSKVPPEDEMPTFWTHTPREMKLNLLGYQTSVSPQAALKRFEEDSPGKRQPAPACLQLRRTHLGRGSQLQRVSS